MKTIITPSLDIGVLALIAMGVGGVAAMVLLWRCGRLGSVAQTIREWKGESQVVPGAMTSGIYACSDKNQVADMVGFGVLAASMLTVRGTVDLWGDAIEHEHGAKGQYAYPRTLDAVACIWCRDWICLLYTSPSPRDS